jgi:hypothetical protein
MSLSQRRSDLLSCPQHQFSPKWTSITRGNTKRRSYSDLIFRACFWDRGGATPHFLRAFDESIVLVGSEGAIRFQNNRSAQLYHLALSEKERWRHCERSTRHVANHGVKPKFTSSANHRQSFCEAATFIKLDVHDAEAPRQFPNIQESLGTFVRRDRDGGMKAIDEIQKMLRVCTAPHRISRR